MKIKDRKEFQSKPKPMTCNEDMTVFDAAKKMRERNFGSIVVVDSSNKILGMFTERDLLNRVVAEGKDPNAVSLADVMTTNVRVAREDDDVVDWLRIMSNERFRRLPIVDEGDRVTGIMTQGDFVSYTWPDLIYQATELAKASIAPGQSLRPILIIGAGMLLYSLALIALLVT